MAKAPDKPSKLQVVEPSNNSNSKLPASVNSHHWTDLGNAERLAEKYGHILKYDAKSKLFYQFNGRLWKETDHTGVIHLASKVVREMYGIAICIEDHNERKDFVNFVKRCESMTMLTAMVKIARSLPQIAIDSEKFDTNPWLMNFENGTYDFQKGAMRLWHKGDYLTKANAIRFDAKAPEPKTFLSFLDRVFAGHQETIEFVQRAVGYSMTGSTKEQCMFILYGSGRNGKSTLINILRELVGEYGQQTPTETLMTRKPGAATNDIARLCGARMASAVESSEGNRLQENLIKQLTGGDRIAARYMFKEWFEFIPQFKLWLACNHKPVIKGTDEAIWRRIRLIPFLVTIAESECDPNLLDKMRRELPGILNWALDGARKWLDSGLTNPSEVKEASASYRAEMDHIQQFLDDCVDVEASKSMGSQDLYEIYNNWCIDSGERAKPIKKFKEGLELKGFLHKHTKTGSVWYGLGEKVTGDGR